MSDPTPAAPETSFADLGLPAPLLKALNDVGYETPSPIQAQTIPPLLEGKDVLGQAQTGTGKTAAFALPMLARIDLHRKLPQALVLAPTRELAIQVAEAFQKYAAHLRGFHVLPIYGGQEYGPQLHALRRGVHVIVGTPGRVIDHMDRGTLKLDELNCLVLDEADEMLRMGFIDDVEKVLKNTPATRQVALFSATMPAAIRRIAQTYLKSPVEVTIQQQDHHGRQHAPALLDGRRRREQARCADAHPRGRAFRRHDRVRAHQAGNHRTRGQAGGARLRRRAAERRRRPEDARAHREPAQEAATSTSSSPPTSPRAASTSIASAT